jgi:hypothetical protein
MPAAGDVLLKVGEPRRNRTSLPQDVSYVRTLPEQPPPSAGYSPWWWAKLVGDLAFTPINIELTIHKNQFEESLLDRAEDVKSGEVLLAILTCEPSRAID